MINSNTLTRAKVKAKVELFDGSTLVRTCTCSDVLQKFTIERTGDNGRFFAYGFCQKATISFIDLWRNLNIETTYTIKIAIGDGTTFIYPYPTFYISEANRNQKNNSITVVAYDKINKANIYHYQDLQGSGISLYDLAEGCAALIGASGLELVNLDSGAFAFDASQANLDGTETIKAVLDAIAGTTQTIYYLNGEDKLVFKRLDKDGEAVARISKSNFYELEVGSYKQLTKLCSTTELGDNLEAELETVGSEAATQYIRNNAFWDLRADRADLLAQALEVVGGIRICQFNCRWVGNYLIELGDKIALVERDTNNIVYSYVLNESFTFDGGITQVYQWQYTDNETETPSTPITVGEIINQTKATVDKVNKQIDLVVGTTDENSNAISKLQIQTSNITAKVLTTEEQVNSLTDTVETLTKEVNLKVDADDVEITISSALENGVDKVKTTTKAYTFDDAGLNISSTDSEISTKITENGMTIYKNTEVVLTADNQGVKAQDLHATSYLIIGNNSRFEDVGNRTACFWIREEG